MKITLVSRNATIDAVIVCVGLANAGLAQDSLRAPVRARSVAEDLQLFSQVFNQIRVNHGDSLDSHTLFMAAIEGMVSAADPHSFVIPAVRLDSAKESAFRSGRTFPIPISFRFVDGAPLVESVASGSKAVSLDILPGDELVAVDGRPVAARSAMELDIALTGSKGSSARLLFRRRRIDGSIVRLERNVGRERVNEVSAVPTAFMLDATTGYVRVTTFLGDKVADDLHDALGKLEGSGMQRLILDVRGNGGGRVDEAKRVAGEFLPRGAIVYTSSGRKAAVTDTGRVQRSFWRSERRYPMILMVDNGTASASELVAGALQDHDRALIVGTPTFGKSLLMQGFPLTDGSLMELVIGFVRTPCGRVIQREYRGETRRAYFRDAGEAADTAGRPSCRTDGGRIVYGGGGIVPDVILPRALTPPWLTEASEHALFATWASGYVAKNGASITTVDALAGPSAMTPATLADFRAYASSNGLPIPDGAAADDVLSRVLARSVALAMFGDEGYYQVAARTDAAVQSAADAFSEASRLAGITGAPR